MCSAGKRLGLEIYYLGLIFGHPEIIQVLFYQSTRFSGPIDKGDERCSARQGLDPDRPGPGTQVEKSRAFGYGRCQNVEKRFTKTVRRRTRFAIWGTLEDAAAVNSGDHSHQK